MSDKQKIEIEFAGVKIAGSKIALLIPVISVLGGLAWGGFEFYNDYRNMKKQIQEYVAPDLSEINKKIAVIEENSAKAVDYTRDIKNDLKQDIRRIETVVEQVERSTKQSQRETEQDVRALRKEVDSKIQKALDNPLAK
jgi:hypothetical protein